MNNEITVELVDSMGGDLSIVNSARTSFNKWKEEFDENDGKLVDFLGRNQHITPFRHNCLQFRCTAPIFLARQLMKHQAGLTWNEMSMRYLDEPVGFYVPEKWRSRPDKSIKQGSGESTVINIGNDEVGYCDIKDAYSDHLTKSIELYEEMLEANVAPEMARMVLPQSMMVTWIWTGNLLAFAHVYNLRAKPDAQLEAQEFANKLEQQIPDDFCVGWNALTK